MLCYMYSPLFVLEIPSVIAIQRVPLTIRHYARSTSGTVMARGHSFVSSAICQVGISWGCRRLTQ